MTRKLLFGIILALLLTAGCIQQQAETPVSSTTKTEINPTPTTPVISYGEYEKICVEITGPEEVVFDWTTDSCEYEDIPDLPARAFRDADGKVQLIATHYIGRRMIGDTLDSVRHDCRVILSSDKDADPSKYNDCEWLGSFYTLDGNTIYALVSNEYHGHEHPGMSVSGDYFKNWDNSITYVQSIDKGQTYTHDDAPKHLVASLPYQYVPEEGPSGISIASNIIHNPKDDYYYAFIHVFQIQNSIYYNSMMRTYTINDPRSWRAWDGTEFAIEFINPYVSVPETPAKYIPKPIGSVGNSLTFNTYLNKYIAVGTDKVYNVFDNSWQTGFFFSLSDNLIDWSFPQLIMEATTNWLGQAGYDEWFSYPSLIDPTDTSRNFEFTGEEPYLYFTHTHPATEENHWGYDRDLVRVPVKFNKEMLQTKWEFNETNNDAGWYPVVDLAPFKITEGVLKTSSNASDPYMHLDNTLNIDAGIYNKIEIRMKVSSGHGGQFYFTTTEDEIWDEEKHIDFNLSSGNDFETYILDMTNIKTCAGNISHIRLDPSDAIADIEIDYIRIYSIDSN